MSGAFELKEFNIPLEKSSPIGFALDLRNDSHRSPVPHAISRTVPYEEVLIDLTVFLRHLISNPKVISRFNMSYRGAIRSNISFTVIAFSEKGGRGSFF